MAVLRNAFWVAALGVIACYVFFLALGAFSATDVLWLTLAVAALVVLWLYHSYLESRHAGEPDPTLARARERRGF
jgi:membrane protein implicated in regulation of membrane protease activity